MPGGGGVWGCVCAWGGGAGGSHTKMGGTVVSHEVFMQGSDSSQTPPAAHGCCCCCARRRPSGVRLGGGCGRRSGALGSGDWWAGLGAAGRVGGACCANGTDGGGGGPLRALVAVSFQAPSAAWAARPRGQGLPAAGPGPAAAWGQEGASKAGWPQHARACGARVPTRAPAGVQGIQVQLTGLRSAA